MLFEMTILLDIEVAKTVTQAFQLQLALSLSYCYPLCWQRMKPYLVKSVGFIIQAVSGTEFAMPFAPLSPFSFFRVDLLLFVQGENEKCIRPDSSLVGKL